MSNTLVVARPSGQAAQLFLLFHGVGASAQGMAPLGRLLAAQFPESAVVCVESPYASDLGSGWQWFSVRGITEENRPQRIAQVMPVFRGTVKRLQDEISVTAAETTLIGFSQGAIMALESLRESPVTSERVVSLAGRLAAPLARVEAGITVHLIHGENDGVVPVQAAREARDNLAGLGGGVTLDVLGNVGHGIDSTVVIALQRRLRESGAAAAIGLAPHQRQLQP
jgi:phospholipase/carboxylesterase